MLSNQPMSSPRSCSDLHEYQQRTIDFLYGHNSAIALLPMGAGKTVSELTAISELLAAGEVTRVLVIAPLRVCELVWEQEARAWEHTAHLTFARCLGSDKARTAALALDAPITLINFENVRWLCRRYPSGGFPFDMVVIDELSRFKSHSGVNYKALAKHLPGVLIRHGLTGTFTSSSLLNVFNQVRAIDLGKRLGKNYTQFRSKYFFPTDYQQYNWSPFPESLEAVMGAIGDITVKLSPDDAIELPPLSVVDVPVALSPDTRMAYALMQDELIVQFKGVDVTAANAAVAVGKLSQITSGFMYSEAGPIELGAEKLDALVELTDDPSPTVVFYWFAEDLKRIKARLPHARALADERNPGPLVDAWNAGAVPVLLLHPASAGHGLNLQAGGCRAIWYSLPWSLELYQQATARLWRQGQAWPVFMHRLVAIESIDEVQVRVLEGRADLAQAVTSLVRAV